MTRLAAGEYGGDSAAQDVDGVVESAGAAFLRAATAPRLGLGALTACYGAILLAYLFQAAVPVYNEDDVNQIFAANAALIEHGRWAYSLIYNWAMHHNPAPVASSVIGLAALLASALLSARLIGLRTAGAKATFALIACVSIHYQFVFSYDSTRLAYPLANLAVALGLTLVVFDPRAMARAGGVLLMALGPAIYPASLMVGATAVLASVARIARADGARAALTRAGLCLGAAAGAMAVYAVVTDVLYLAMDWELSGRAALDPFGVGKRLGEIGALLALYAPPFLGGGADATYFPPIYRLGVAALFIAFLAAMVAPSLREGRTLDGAVAGFAGLLMFVSPFCLIFITLTTYYPERSLFAFATAYAGFAALALDAALGTDRARRRLRAWTVIGLAGGFAAVNMMLISQRSYDEYLAWQTDRVMVERMISRIDDVVGAEGFEVFGPSRLDDAPTAIPVAVFGMQYWRAGGRGSVQTMRLFHFSREKVFHMLDPRLVKASWEQRQAVLPEIGERRPWPAPESVFLHDGVIVVLISDEGVTP